MVQSDHEMLRGGKRIHTPAGLKVWLSPNKLYQPWARGATILVETPKNNSAPSDARRGTQPCVSRRSLRSLAACHPVLDLKLQPLFSKTLGLHGQYVLIGLNGVIVTFHGGKSPSKLVMGVDVGGIELD